jgi:hypothetical protein
MPNREERSMKVARYSLWLFPFLLFPACSSRDDESHGVSDDGGGNGGTGAVSNGGATAGTGNVIIVAGSTGAGTGGTVPMGPCSGLSCDLTTCTQGSCTQEACGANDPGMRTSISGTVYDPAGKVPLYNIIVYIPSTPPPAFTSGAACDVCGQGIVNPVASTLTDTAGNFTIDAPVGSNIPLVIQIGKWRRQITIPSVARCTNVALTDREQTSLPSNKGEGDIPLIALTTGGADSMECLPRRMGIEDSEITDNAGTGRIHLYAGVDTNMENTATKAFDSGAAIPAADTLWSTTAALAAYDIVILSCEGDSTENERPPTARQSVFEYANMGGRLFASHWHHRWISEAPDPFPTTGTWNDLDNPENPIDATINQTFPKGMALAQWLVNVGASMTAGTMQVLEARNNVQAVNTAVATEWMTVPGAMGGGRGMGGGVAIEYMSFNTPVGAPETMMCGRVVYTDLHVSNATDMMTDGDDPGMPFPSHCAVRDLTPQEKAVEFMLFDLSSCVQDDDVPPTPPR